MEDDPETPFIITPVATDIEPLILMFLPVASVKVKTPLAGLPKVISRHAEFAVIVTVYPVAFEALSKMTLSDAVGTEKPLDPPEESDQCVVLEASQFHEPPTQYLAINLFS
jgi:hypothetical protein